MTATYQFAGVPVRLTTLYALTHKMCADYRSSAGPVIEVATTEGDIASERQRASCSEDAAANRLHYQSDAYLETLAAYRKLCEALPSFGAFLVHGSALAADGLGYLFVAPSGIGKSTHARHWRSCLGERVTMVNDDKPLIKVTDGGVFVCGTPWDGKHRLSSNVEIPLKAICLLERAEENRVEPIGLREAYPRLLGQVFRPASGESLGMVINLLDRTIVQVGLWRLCCNDSDEAARVAAARLLPRLP